MVLRKAYREYFKGDGSLLDKADQFYLLPKVENVLEQKNNELLFFENLDLYEIVNDDELYLLLFSSIESNGWDVIVFDKEDIKKINIPFGVYVYKFLKIKKQDFDKELLKQKLIASIDESISSYFNYISRNKNTQNVYCIGSNNEVINKTFIKNAILGESNKINIGLSNYKIDDEKRYFFKGIALKRNILKIDNLKQGGSSLFLKNDNICILEGQDENCIFNNCLISSPNLDVTEKVYKFSSKGSLAIRTKIKEPTKENDNYIVVEDTSYVMLGHKIGFMTKNNGFSYRKVTGVDGNKIFLDKPLLKGDDTFIGAIVKSDLPEEYDRFETTLSRDSKEYNRRFYLKDDPPFSLYLREVEIGDFKSVVTYYDSISNLLLTADISDNSIPMGTKVVCPEFKFKNSFQFKYGEPLPVVYIGQTIEVDGTKCKIIGFNKKDNTLKVDNQNIKLDGATITTYFDESILTTNIYGKELEIIEFKKYNNYFITSSDVSIYEHIRVGNTTLEVQNIKKIDDKTIVILKTSMLPKILDGYILLNNIIAEKDVNPNLDNYIKQLSDLKEKYENNN